MRLLLDTHAFIWWSTDDPKLSDDARRHIDDSKNVVLVSAVSAWELATKQRIGKLDLPQIVAEFSDLIAADGFVHLPVGHLHGLRAGGYDIEHRDPFDRMLAAQAELEQLTLVTRDRAMQQFPVTTLW